MLKSVTVALLFPLCVSLSGCVTSETVIKVKPDGSGMLVQKTLMKTEMLTQLRALMEGMIGQAGGSSTAAPTMPDIFSEKEAQAKAAKLGTGVTYVTSRKVEAGGMEGIEATYAFRDVTQLRLSEKPEGPALPGVQAPSGKNGEIGFRFSRLPNNHALLTAVFGQSNRSEPVTPATDKPQTSQADPAQLGQVKKILEGLRMAVSVEVQGNLVKTNSSYQEGSKVTLLELDFSELLSNDAQLSQIAGVIQKSPREAKELLKGLKGFKVNPEPEVTIEFSGGSSE